MFGFGKRDIGSVEALSQRMSALEEDRRAFSFGVQMANEAILRALTREVLTLSPADEWATRAARIRADIDAAIRATLVGSQVPHGLEARAAADVIESVFGDAPVLLGQDDARERA
jgi:hypothetical protein